MQVVEDSMGGGIKEELEDGSRGAGGGGSVVASVLSGKTGTISYVVTTDHAGNLHAQPHDPR